MKAAAESLIANNSISDLLSEGGSSDEETSLQPAQLSITSAPNACQSCLLTSGPELFSVALLNPDCMSSFRVLYKIWIAVWEKLV